MFWQFSKKYLQKGEQDIIEPQRRKIRTVEKVLYAFLSIQNKCIIHWKLYRFGIQFAFSTSEYRNITGSRGARKPFDNTYWVYVKEELLYSDFRKIPQFFHQQSGLKKVIYPSSCSMQPSD